MVNYRHGHSRPQSPTYRSWAAMMRRCYNAETENYAFYGARGITVDSRWQTFQNFLDDMGERPKGTTIGRRDAKKGYNKDNCSWETRREQARGSSKFSTEQAIEICELFRLKEAGVSIRQWAEEIAPSYNISPSTIKRLVTDRNYRKTVDDL